MHDEHLAVVETRQEIFRAPVESLDFPPFEPLGEALGQREAQILAPLLDARELVADQDWLKAPSHRLDLWKLRHGLSLIAAQKAAPLQCNNSLILGLALLSASHVGRP